MVKLAIFSVFALCVFKSISCERVEFGDCGSQMSTLKEVDITPCPQATEKRPCQLKRGTEETIEVKFTPKENITAATTKVYGTVAGIRVPFSVDNPNACEDQGITCPMIAGKDYTFKTVLPIKSIYPSVDVIVQWEMQDQDKNMVYCWIVTAHVSG
ncbi:NPC intracellular cholesterol transporter 2-like [Porites lutea]|uniref:NPC intracellular cholesterol transporter 2-like n=1 Tax=Porites lutea TaxID=51062 RepID=UPI003CC5A1BA